jgi:hypothetical protein
MRPVQSVIVPCGTASPPGSRLEIEKRPVGSSKRREPKKHNLDANDHNEAITDRALAQKSEKRWFYLDPVVTSSRRIARTWFRPFL